MERMTMLYDPRCGFCRRIVRWLSRERSFFPIELLPNDAPEILERFRGVVPLGSNELVVVGDDRLVYRGDAAYLMCLYALRRYRPLSFRLASPLMRPFARTFFLSVARNRYLLSAMLRADRNLPDCAGACSV